MIVQKPQFDDSYLEPGQAIMIVPGANDGKATMQYIFGGCIAVSALIVEVEPFRLQIAYVGKGNEVEGIDLPIDAILNEKLVINVLG